MKRYHVSGLVVLAAWLVGTAWGQAEKPDADEIFRTAEPGIVVVRDVLSHGSGVIIDETGRVLTNFHCCADPLPREVVAQVTVGGGDATAGL